MTVRVRALSIAAALAMAVLPAGLARANASAEILHVYETYGSIPPCIFTSAQLNGALKGIDTYGAQYFEDFTNAVQAALAARATGACSRSQQQAAPPAAGASGRFPALPQVSITGGTGAGVPAPIALMAVIGGLIALCIAASAIARWRGWQPPWLQSWRHAWQEAGYRANGTWTEFRDWMRSTH
jgi:hypothetical protein